MGLETQRSVHSEQPQARESGYAEAIARIAQAQDRNAFSFLFQVFAPRLKTFFLRRGVAAEQAEDLAQECMARVWRAAGGYDPGQATVAGWIFAIARNLLIDAYRKSPRASDMLASALDGEAPETPAEAYETEERGVRLHQAMKGLSDEQKEVLQLAFFEGHTQAEVAALLSLPLGTVKSRIRLAMLRVRTLLGEP